MRRILRPRFMLVGSLAVALIIGGGLGSRAGARTASQFAVANAAVQHTRESPTPEPAPLASVQVTPPVHKEAPREAENESPGLPPLTTTATAFSLIGGTATFSCSGNDISLQSAVPKGGFTVEAEQEDSGREVEVKFDSDRHRSEIRATCITGQVEAAEIQEEAE